MNSKQILFFHQIVCTLCAMQELEKVTNQFKNEKAAHDMLKGKYKEVSI